MCHQNPSASSPLALKFGSLKILTSYYFQVFNSHVSASAGVADAATEDICNNFKTGLSRQLTYMAQLDPIIGALKPGGGVSMWERLLLTRGKLSRPGRLVKSLGHHKIQPNALPDMQCAMFVKKPTKRHMRIFTPSLQKSATLLTSLEERTLLLLVANQ